MLALITPQFFHSNLNGAPLSLGSAFKRGDNSLMPRAGVILARRDRETTEGKSLFSNRSLCTSCGRRGHDSTERQLQPLLKAP